MTKAVKEWQEATQKLAEAFTQKYFDCFPDCYWVANEIGGVYFINDYFFNVEQMRDALLWDVESELLFDWYSDCIEGDCRLNFKYYVKKRRDDITNLEGKKKCLNI